VECGQKIKLYKIMDIFQKRMYDSHTECRNMKSINIGDKPGKCIQNINAYDWIDNIENSKSQTIPE